MENKVILWKGNAEIKVPSNVSDINEIVTYGAQLSKRDRTEIVTAFKSKNYQMLATYIWSKAVGSLKVQLSKMGPAFIGEMLNRPEITEASNLQYLITDFEAVQLAEELGIITGTGAFRLKQSFELVTHFNNPELMEEEAEFTKEDAITVVRSTIQSILGYERIDSALDFKNFRESLENQVLDEDGVVVQKLVNSPYFFQMATVRILLALVKSKTGAQLDNSLSNANVILPLIWDKIRQPEKWQVGRCYAELFSDGKTIATNGLKNVLLKVKGFDFVPEDLRSTSFIKAANEILGIHNSSNNYYHEPSAAITLLNMGSTIPMPAFPICMTAILSVRLGNAYGISWNAQDPIDKILNNLTPEKWTYYFDECFINDERIINKLTFERSKTRWFELIKSIKNIDKIVKELRDKDSQELLNSVIKNKRLNFDGVITGLRRRRVYTD